MKKKNFKHQKTKVVAICQDKKCFPKSKVVAICQDKKCFPKKLKWLPYVKIKKVFQKQPPFHFI